MPYWAVELIIHHEMLCKYPHFHICDTEGLLKRNGQLNNDHADILPKKKCYPDFFLPLYWKKGLPILLQCRRVVIEYLLSYPAWQIPADWQIQKGCLQ